MKIHIDFPDGGNFHLELPTELVGAIIGAAALLGLFALFTGAA